MAAVSPTSTSSQGLVSGNSGSGDSASNSSKGTDSNGTPTRKNILRASMMHGNSIPTLEGLEIRVIDDYIVRLTVKLRSMILGNQVSELKIQ